MGKRSTLLSKKNIATLISATTAAIGAFSFHGHVTSLYNETFVNKVSLNWTQGLSVLSSHKNFKNISNQTLNPLVDFSEEEVVRVEPAKLTKVKYTFKNQKFTIMKQELPLIADETIVEQSEKYISVILEPKVETVPEANPVTSAVVESEPTSAHKPGDLIMDNQGEVITQFSEMYAEAELDIQEFINSGDKDSLRRLLVEKPEVSPIQLNTQIAKQAATEENDIELDALEVLEVESQPTEPTSNVEDKKIEIETVAKSEAKSLKLNTESISVHAENPIDLDTEINNQNQEKPKVVTISRGDLERATHNAEPEQAKMSATKKSMLAESSVYNGDLNTQSDAPSKVQVVAPQLDTQISEQSGIQKLVEYPKRKKKKVVTPAPDPTPLIHDFNFSGNVVEAMTDGVKKIEEASVQIIGSFVGAESTLQGDFHLSNVSAHGLMPVYISKNGYLPRKAHLKNNNKETYELVSENFVSLTSIALGEQRDSKTAFLLGKLTSTNTSESLAGIRVELEGVDPAKIIYFDENGIPSRSQKSTASSGKFLVFNLTTGTHLVVLSDSNNVERAPHVIHLGPGEGLSREFSLGERKVIRGTVLNVNSNNAPVAEAQIQLLGSVHKTKADKNGRFSLGPIFVDCNDELNNIQIERDGFYRNRLIYRCDDTSVEPKERAFYIAPMSYIDSLSLDAETPLDSNSGFVLGHLSFTDSVKVQLWGPDEITPNNKPRGKDFYFDNAALISPMLNRTNASNGNFVILDAPDGLSYVQVISRQDKTLSYWPVLLAPGTVNIYSQ